MIGLNLKGVKMVEQFWLACSSALLCESILIPKSTNITTITIENEQPFMEIKLLQL
jgi:hypothetical protein